MAHRFLVFHIIGESVERPIHIRGRRPEQSGRLLRCRGGTLVGAVSASFKLENVWPLGAMRSLFCDFDPSSAPTLVSAKILDFHQS